MDCMLLTTRQFQERTAEPSLDAAWMIVGIVQPHEFQVQAIYRGAYYENSVMSITAKVGYGKPFPSSVPLFCSYVNNPQNLSAESTQ